jgi:hypothetical protein
MTAEEYMCLILFCACSDNLPCFRCIPVTEYLLFYTFHGRWAGNAVNKAGCPPPPRMGHGPAMNVCLMWVGKLRQVFKCQCSDTQSSEWRVKSIPKTSCVSDIQGYSKRLSGF